MLRAILATNRSAAPLVLRLGLGGVFFPHGAQKALGIWGGRGFSKTLEGFEGMGFPAWLSVLAIAAEFLGAIALVFGFLTRVAAFGIACVMVVAIWKAHWKYGFFMDWFGTQEGQGFEYHLLAIAIALALMIQGGGALSVDRRLTTRRLHLPSAP